MFNRYFGEGFWLVRQRLTGFVSLGNDSYEQLQQRREAAIVLDSPELLMMHAQARNDVSLGFYLLPFSHLFPQPAS